MPSVCGLCPVGCNIDVDHARGQGQADPLAQPPRGRREAGSATRGASRFSHLYAEDRITEPLAARPPPRAGGDLLGGRARRRRAAAPRGGRRGSRSRSPARRRRSRRTHSPSSSASVSAPTRRCCPRRSATSSTRSVVPLSAIRDAELIVVLGDDPVVERAPIVDLWLRKARRAGAEIVEIGPAGDVQVAPGTTARACRNLKRGELGNRLRASERAIVIWSGAAVRAAAPISPRSRPSSASRTSSGCGAFFLPETANGRGVAEAWAAASDEERPGARAAWAADRLRRRGGREPERARAGRARGARAGDHDVPLARRRLGRPRPAGDELPRARRHLRQRRGPDSAPAPSGDPADARRARLDRPARRALRARALRPTRRSSSRSCRNASSAASPTRTLGEEARLPERVPSRPLRPRPPTSRSRRRQRPAPCRLLRYRPLFSGAAVERVPELQFQRPAPEIELSARDAKRLGVKRGGAGQRPARTERSVELRTAINKRLKTGVARIAGGPRARPPCPRWR